MCSETAVQKVHTCCQKKKKKKNTYIECSWTPALHYCTRPDACRNVDMVLSHKKDVSRLSQYLTLQLLSGDQVSAVHAAGPAPVH